MALWRFDERSFVAVMQTSNNVTVHDCEVTDLLRLLKSKPFSVLAKL